MAYASGVWQVWIQRQGIPEASHPLPNQSHQADHVGSCYLKGPVRFYSLNIVGVATSRCGLHPSLSKSGQSVIDGLWSIWIRIGIPDNLQIDNNMSFYGSQQYLMAWVLWSDYVWWMMWSLGLSRLLNRGATEWSRSLIIITIKSFLTRRLLLLTNELAAGSFAFEQRHNCSYRYSKLGGKTPLKALKASTKSSGFPQQEESPKHPQKSPRLVGIMWSDLLKSNKKLNVFGEIFLGAFRTWNMNNVVATIDVKSRN